MLHYYVHASGDAVLDLSEVARIAGSKNGWLKAVDAIDSSEIAAGKAQLPPKTVNDERDYLFLIKAEDQEAAEYAARDILDTALTERDRPVYSNFLQLLREYPQASWRDHIQATLTYSEDEIDLVIFVPGRSESDPAKIYYRGRADTCCLDLIRHFTKIQVKR